jgi:hypothetical protein
MKLLARKLGKADRHDLLVCTRADGSTTQVQMPRQGVLPHDLVHYVVESALPFRHGFLSQVAEGAGIAFDSGVSYIQGPERHVVESGQVESIVEALQSQLWAGAFDLPSFLEGVRLACASRGLAAPELPAAGLESALFERAVRLNEAWLQVAPQQAMALAFARGAGTQSADRLQDGPEA